MAVFEDRLLPAAAAASAAIGATGPAWTTRRPSPTGCSSWPTTWSGLRGDLAHPMATYLHALADPLHRVLKVNFVYLIDLARWVGELPFETPSERRALLDVFDQVMSETEAMGMMASSRRQPPSPASSQQWPIPSRGERVYDPCVGSGATSWLPLGSRPSAAAWSNAVQVPLLEVAGIEINAQRLPDRADAHAAGGHR
ncbi:MAG: hypothetical protein MZU91_13005 [Desulfosudis oleivorans]|nr:hypothetical protein [Desulfosudis oleivorans]